MAVKQVHSVLYRAVLPNGEMWSESSDLSEVLIMSRGKGCTYQKQTTLLVTGGWNKLTDAELRGDVE